MTLYHHTASHFLTHMIHTPQRLFLGLGEALAHVPQGGEAQIQIVHVVLAENGQPQLGVAGNDALCWLQLATQQVQ